jgi:hypothetical protein
MGREFFIMQHPAALAIALALLMIGSWAVLAPGAAHGQTIPRGGHVLPAGSGYVNPYGTCGGVYYVGYDCGQVYFGAYDPSDNTATVQINDYNATRDNLTNPVVSWTVGFQTSVFNDSYSSNVHYLIPLSLHNGGLWNITINGQTAGFSYSNFTVGTYQVAITPTMPVVLAQHPGTILYFVNWTANNAPDMAIGSLVLTAQYETNTATWAPLPGTPKTLGTAPWGSYNFTVPTDANTYGAIEFTLYANVTGGESENGFLDLSVGYVADPFLDLSTCATGCFTSSFTDGTPVYATVTGEIIGPGGYAPAAGLTATFEFLSGVTPVNPMGGFPHSITLNASGAGQILFIASSANFTTSGTNTVRVTLTDALNSGNSYGPTNATFTVSPPSPGTARLQVMLDSSQYYGGDTATATWELGGLNTSIAQGWTVTGWWAWEFDTATYIASGTVSSTALEGTFSFPVPLNYGGRMQVVVTANNATSWLQASQIVIVSAPTVFLNSNELYYTPGDTVTFTVSTVGSVFGSATWYRTVTDNSGNLLQSGAFTGNQITVPIPAVGAPNDITVSVAAQDGMLGIVGAASDQVSLASGFGVSAGVSTVSNYEDGSFQPGQTIQIHYVIAAIGNAVLPKTFSVEVYPYAAYFGGSSGAKVVQTSSASGDIPYTIPSNTPTGAQLFEIFVVANGCYSGCYTGSAFSISVESNPSALGYELGAGSGVTVGWTILLVLILLVAIVLFMIIRRRNRPMVMKPSSPPPSASGGGSSSEGGPSGGWNEASSGGGGSNPPLPNPK